MSKSNVISSGEGVSGLSGCSSPLRHTADGAIKTARELEFAVFCIENVSAALGKPTEYVYDALSGEDGILRQYIVPSYDVLHTQGKEYIVNDIIEVIKERHVTI